MWIIYLIWWKAAAALAPATGSSTAVRTVLVGDQALGPIAWVAPEVLAGSLVKGVTATPASDVYMLGGLMFEVLTCGLTPYYWCDIKLVAQVLHGRQNVVEVEKFICQHGSSAVCDLSLFILVTFEFEGSCSRTDHRCRCDIDGDCHGDVRALSLFRL